MCAGRNSDKLVPYYIYCIKSVYREILRICAAECSIVDSEPKHAAYVVRKPVPHVGHEMPRSLLCADAAFVDKVLIVVRPCQGTIAKFSVPRPRADIRRHIQGSALVVIAHERHDIFHSQLRRHWHMKGHAGP